MLFAFTSISLSAIADYETDYNAAEAVLSSEELIWLEKHPVIKIAPDPEFRPIEFFDSNGTYSGMASDYAMLIGKKLGISFTVVKCKDWNEVMEKVQNQEVDILNAVIRTPDREKYLNFSYPYLRIPSVIIVKDSDLTYRTLDSLKNKTAVMVQDYGYTELIIKQNPLLNIITAPNLMEALKTVSLGEADAFIGDLATASYYIRTENLGNLRVSAEIEPPNISGFAVRSDWPELISILDKGISLLSNEEKLVIHRKWINVTPPHAISTDQIRSAVIIVGAIFLFIFAATMTWIHTLRKMVHLKTEQLQNELQERKKMERISAESESRLQAFLSTIPDPVWLKDKDGKFLFCNHVLSQIFGAPPKMIVGKTDHDFMDKEKADSVRKNDIMTVKSDKAQKFEESVFDVSKGRITYMETYKTPMFDPDGRLTGVLGIGRDITDRILYEKEIKLKNDELIEINNDLHQNRDELKKTIREKETLIRELYHRTKNTLQMINSMIVLQSKEHGENIAIQKMIANTESRIHSISLVHQMLYQSNDLSKISVKNYITSLAEKITESFGLNKDTISLKIDIEDNSFSIDTAIPFGLIINELITNSCKYAFTDIDKAAITIKMNSSGNNTYHFYYRDYGKGVPEGFDFRKSGSMGLQLIYTIGEHQLMGKVDMQSDNGVICTIDFQIATDHVRV
ncbi:MAG: transporter substrate-binding domain-containing protein [Spirochaetes bacterium]|nr:transporter substrate-binding domain-containing protein [Spirochaetota bacterium]